MADSGFLRGGGANSPGSTNIQFCQIFPKLHEIEGVILGIHDFKTGYNKILFCIFLSEQGLADESYQSSGFQDQSSENLNQSSDVHNQSSGSRSSHHNRSTELDNQTSGDLPTDLSSTSDSAFETGNGSSVSESDSFLSNDAEHDVMMIARSRDLRNSQLYATVTETVVTSSDEDETIDVD